jgi:hypothetical protein
VGDLVRVTEKDNLKEGDIGIVTYELPSTSEVEISCNDGLWIFYTLQLEIVSHAKR